MEAPQDVLDLLDELDDAQIAELTEFSADQVAAWRQQKQAPTKAGELVAWLPEQPIEVVRTYLNHSAKTVSDKAEKLVAAAASAPEPASQPEALSAPEPEVPTEPQADRGECPELVKLLCHQVRVTFPGESRETHITRGGVYSGEKAQYLWDTLPAGDRGPY